MSMIDRAMKDFRDFVRYAGDGLPEEPIGAPLPVGDPESGVYNPKKKDLRDLAVGVASAVDAAAGYAASASGTPLFVTRESALTASMPAWAQQIIVDGLTFARDPSGTALTTAGGAKWSPVGIPTPQHFGDTATAVGFTSAIQAMMAWLATRPVPRACTIPAGFYQLNAQITVPDQTTVFGQGCIIDMSACAAQTSAFFAGNSEGARYPLTADAKAGAFSTSVAPADALVSGIRAGDWVRLTSSARFDPERTSSRVGEMAQVRTLNTATGAITLGTPIAGAGGAGAAPGSPLIDSYLVSAGATISALNPVRGIHFTGRGLIRSSNDLTKAHKAITLQGSSGCSVSGWGGEKIDDRFLHLVDTVNFVLDDLFVSDFLSSGTGYGVSVGGASQDIYISGLRGFEVRHLFTTNNPVARPGIPRRIVVDGFVAINSRPASTGAGGDAIDTHAAADHVTFSNGVVRNPSGLGINVECPNAKIVNVDVHGVTAGRAVSLLNYSGRNGRYQTRGLRIFGSGDSTSAMRVGPQSTGKVLEADIEVSIFGAGGMALHVTGKAGNTIGYAKIDATINGYVSNSGAVFLDMVDAGRVTSADIRGSTVPSNPLMRLRECRNISVVSITGEVAPGFTGKAISIDTNSAGVNILGANLVSSSDAGGYGIYAGAGTSDIIEMGSILTGFATAKAGF